MTNTSELINTLTNLTADHGMDAAIHAPGEKSLNYNQLRAQMLYCVNVLNSLSIKASSRVAVILPNGPEMATCCLGVMASAICAPLNPGYNESDFRFYLEDLDASIVIIPYGSNSKAKKIAEKSGIHVLELISDNHLNAGEFHFAEYDDVTSNVVPIPLAESTALILHTSGTTSRPKIVPLSHKNLYTSACNVSSSLLLNNNDSCLNVMPLFHIHGIVAALLAPLVSEGSVICTPGFNDNNFLQWISEYQPSWYTAVPTIHQSVLKLSDEYHAINENHQFRFIRSSSSALPPATLNALQKMFNTPVIEAYGMTEAAHQMTCNPLQDGKQKNSSVGLQAGPEVAIMNTHNELLDIGETGEIVIRGNNVFCGYENNEKANKESFSSGWFRTGDQGYFDKDGYLFISGRLKEIINRGGEKISPREIDEVLTEHPFVLQAVAFSLPHESLGEDIAAAVVLKPNQKMTEQMLRFYLFDKLSDFKVPSKVIFLDEIPKGATGKIQRLKMAELLADYLQEKHIAPVTDIQRYLSNIFHEVLNIDPIGCTDNFFTIGGDSLQATQVISRVNAYYDIDLPIPFLFRYPSITELSSQIESALQNQEEAMAQLVTEIENLSDEEIERLLNE